ncbi:MAG: hypothetical protein BWZ03_00655 [bacterium ADurb.BinA186]|nr:MAG: hypothetical protein BWZ03_00655 [bacterium ADurb.BinA186]
MISGCLIRGPDFFSTVTPGQLPINWFEPVRALKRVVLPELGLPTRAKVLLSMILSLGYLNDFRFRTADDEVGLLEFHLDWVP